MALHFSTNLFQEWSFNFNGIYISRIITFEYSDYLMFISKLVLKKDTAYITHFSLTCRCILWLYFCIVLHFKSNQNLPLVTVLSFQGEVAYVKAITFDFIGGCIVDDIILKETYFAIYWKKRNYYLSLMWIHNFLATGLSWSLFKINVYMFG